MTKHNPVFTDIDSNTWPRQPYFDHYYHNVKCTYSITLEVDITKLLEVSKNASVKLYPAMLYIISTAVNLRQELCTTRTSEGSLGYWDVMYPCYTVFHDDDKTFSNLWTEYNRDFANFYKSFLQDIKMYGDKKGFNPKGSEPANSFPISCIPWIDFTGFNLNIYDDARYLSPIFTIGKYSRKEDKVVIPISVQLHHALCDGYHAGLLFDAIKGLASNPEQWLTQ